MSAYSIARTAVTDALTAAAADGIEPDTLLRAILGTLAEQYRDLKGADDLRKVLQYELDNAGGDVDYEFMRP